MKRARPAATRGQGVSHPWAALSTVAIAAIAVALLFKLVPLAARAKLFTDECFHAYLAEWIAAHGRLPDRLPEFYSGLWYSYPPLLHLIGAVWLKLFGVASLVQLNVLLFATLLAVLALLPVPGITAAPRRWAILLCIANAWLADYSVRFYAEMLISALGVSVALLILRFWRTEQARDAVFTGIATGLALLAKQTALVLPVLLGLLAGWALVVRQPKRARGLALALLIGLAIALPMFIRNAMLYGSPIYPALAHDVDRELLRLYQHQFGYALPNYALDCCQACGPYVLVGALAALALAALRRRGDIVVGLLALCPVGVVLNFLTPLPSVRHILPLVPVMALLASIVLYEELRRRRRLVAVLEVGLLVLAAVTVVRMGDIRKPFDPYKVVVPVYEVMPSVVPEDATVLSLYTYDTFYYTHCKTTWPLAWGQAARLTELFQTKDPDRFLAVAKQNNVTYMLTDRWPGGRFEGSNYSRTFAQVTAALVERGRMKVVWKDANWAILAVNP